MRIISGKFKGKKISLPKDKKTRPLRDLVKESVFNLIQHSKKFNCKIDDSNVLDLFSGSGSFGLECISRNANKVVFIENYVEALSVLKKNTLILKNTESFKIYEEDCFNFLKSKKLNEKFDIIFLDPPYKEGKINLIIESIKKNNVLSKDGVIIIHRHKKDDVDISLNLNILDERNYGISKIIIGN